MIVKLDYIVPKQGRSLRFRPSHNLHINTHHKDVDLSSATAPPQVFDNTPAGKDGTLQSGDELIGVNGTSVKGRTKVEVAKIIQAVQVWSKDFLR